MSKIHLFIVGAVMLGLGLFLGSSPANTETIPSVSATTMSASADGVAIWQFPDTRALDPELFGIPNNPRNINLLPLVMRSISEDGSTYTRTTNPSMFSDKIKETTGSITISVNDLTNLDNPNSQDTAEMEANFTGPEGEKFRVVLKKLIPVGPNHEFFGGVGTNVLMHGATGVGTPLVVKEFSYITLWGIGDFYKEGELVDTGRVIHVMVSERTRDANYKLSFGVALPNELEIHLAMPPLKGSPTGPVASPLPTGIILPNGSEQPFIHTNFYGNIVLTGNQFTQ